jgi:hypothetical protein
MQLEERWTKTEKKAEHYEQLYQQSTKTLTSVRAAIQSIFNRIGCNTADTIERVGTPNISESSMIKFLAAIEHRTMEIVTHHHATSGAFDSAENYMFIGAGAGGGKSGKTGKGGTGGGTTGGAGGAGGGFKLPSTVEDLSDEDEEEEEDDQRPFNRDELKQRIVRVFQKRHDKLKQPKAGNTNKK